MICKAKKIDASLDKRLHDAQAWDSLSITAHRAWDSNARLIEVRPAIQAPQHCETVPLHHAAYAQADVEAHVV